MVVVAVGDGVVVKVGVEVFVDVRVTVGLMV
jgi:hypothetical protein